MANTYNPTVFGNLKVVYGTYLASSTTVTLTTGMTSIQAVFMQSTGNATEPIVTSTTSGTITATTASSDTGYYMAIGF